MALSAIKSFKTLLAATACFLCGCVESTSPRTESKARLRDMVIEPLIKFEREDPINCESADLKRSLETATVLTRRAKTLETRQIMATLMLEIADRAFNKGCLDFAAGAYRQVVSTFSGPEYATHRQQAEMGLENIRAARKGS